MKMIMNNVLLGQSKKKKLLQQPLIIFDKINF